MEMSIMRPVTKPIIACLVLVLSFIFIVIPVKAQDGYRLNVSRVFGYSGGSDIRGTFSAAVIGDTAAIQSVTFQIDGQAMLNGTFTTPPFKLQFQTQDYPFGWHDLTALIQTKDGRSITTTTRRYQFVSSSEEGAAVAKITIPLLGGTFLLILFGLGIQVLALRNKPKVSLPLGTPRKYGLNGGSICPHCHRPYPLHWWSFNVGLRYKYDRCDFCGKWGRVKVLKQQELKNAETLELKMAEPDHPMPTLTPEEKVRQQLDDSRFTDKF
jgi:hypothetical protein